MEIALTGQGLTCVHMMQLQKCFAKNLAEHVARHDQRIKVQASLDALIEDHGIDAVRRALATHRINAPE